MAEDGVKAGDAVPNYGEVGEIRSDLVGMVMAYMGDYNPETITISTFRKMIHEDAQVAAAFNFLVMAVMAKGWEYNYTGKDAKWGKKVEAEIKELLGDINSQHGIRGGLPQAIREMMSAIWAGFSATEVVWDYHEKLKMHAPSKLKTLPPETIKFYSDELGNLKELWQYDYDVYNSSVFKDSDHISLPLERMLIWSYRKEFGNKYGISDLKPCYKYWFIKDFVLKFWSIFIERYGSPFILGKTRAARMDSLRNALKEIMTKTDFVLELEDEAEILETKHEGEQFEKIINYCDKMIMMSFLVPAMVINPPAKGARALGDTVMKAFGWRAESIQEEIEFLLNALIKWIIDYNYDKPDGYLKFHFKPLTQYDEMKMAQAIELLVRARVIHPTEAWIRDHLTFPDADPDILKLLTAEPAPPQPGQPPNATKPQFGVPNVPQTAPPPKTKPEESYKPRGSKQEFDALTPSPKAPDTQYKKLVQFAEMEAFLDMQEAKLYLILADWMANVHTLVFKEMENIGLISESKALDINPPPFDYALAFKIGQPPIGGLQSSLDSYFTELTSATVAAEASNLVEMGMSASFDVEARLGALNWIEQNMAERMNLVLARGGDIATDMQYKIWKATKRVVMQGLQEGMDIGRIKKELKANFGNMYSKARLETIARTNVNYAYNAGRLGFYKANKDFVKAVEYTATLDRRTTDFCREMDGTIVGINDPRVERFTPPNHFNCRSAWLPVTVMDTNVEPNFDEEGMTNVPQEGFSSLTGAL